MTTPEHKIMPAKVMKVKELALHCAASKPWRISTKGYSASVPAQINECKGRRFNALCL